MQNINIDDSFFKGGYTPKSMTILQMGNVEWNIFNPNPEIVFFLKYFYNLYQTKTIDECLLNVY